MKRSYSPKHTSELVEFIRTSGMKQPSERGDTYEVLGMSLKVNNPRNRLDTTRSRKLNLAFAFAEWLSLMTGENRIQFFTNFIKNYSAYSSDGETLDGAYGARVSSDIRQICKILNDNPESRRAALTIFDGKTDLYGGGGLNTPCTVSFHFLRRNGAIHMFTNMRSNDVHYGLTNDIIVNTMLQEWVALKTRSSLGHYHHYADTLHVYESALEVVKYSDDEGRWPHVMSAMPAEMLNEDELSALRQIYLKCYEPYPLMAMQVEGLHSQYAKDMGYTALAFANRKTAPLSAKEALQKIEDITIKRIMKFWVDGAKEKK
jgi:thymidylate synthase